MRQIMMKQQAAAICETKHLDFLREKWLQAHGFAFRIPTVLHSNSDGCDISKDGNSLKFVETGGAGV